MPNSVFDVSGVNKQRTADHHV